MTTQQKIEKVIEAGSLAPSIDNCQPWFFSLDNASVNIYLDKIRAEFFGDYDFTASYVTIGAVIENMLIAANHFGLTANITLMPKGEENTPVATIAFTEGERLDAQSSLFPYLVDRCTNRKKYKKAPLDNETVNAFLEITKPTGACLHLVHDRKIIQELYLLTSCVDKIIFEHELLHSNLFKWIRWDEKDAISTKDGMHVDTLELDVVSKLFFRFISSWSVMKILNHFYLSSVIGKINSSLLLNSSALGIITMENNNHLDYLNGGRFFERIWLKAASMGLQLQPFGGISFLTTRILQAGDKGLSQRHYKMLIDVHRKLCEMFPLKDNNAFIILFRLGYSDKPQARTFRRPVSEVLR